MLGPLYTIVSWVIVQFHSFFSLMFNPDGGLAWGLSIVLLVLVIRAALIPLFVKQIKATRAMSALQPQMKAIQERYKNDKQRQSEEMMKLYKEAGTNPFSSCLPIIVQSPFFISLYQVLKHIADNKPVGVITVSSGLLASAGKAHIFGAPLAATFVGAGHYSNSTNIRIVAAIMIVMMSASQFLTQRQLMTKNMDTTVKTPFGQQQKLLMYVFPVMFAVFGINFPIGVLVYWLTTNVWTMCQQLIVIRRNPTPNSQAWRERQERLKAHGLLDAKGNEIKRSFFGFGKPKASALAAAAVMAEEQEEQEAAQGRRQQPKRTTKSQRQGGAAVQDTRPPEDAAPQGSATGAAKKPSGQPARKTAAGGKPARPATGSAAAKSTAAKGTPAKKAPAKSAAAKSTAAKSTAAKSAAAKKAAPSGQGQKKPSGQGGQGGGQDGQNNRRKQQPGRKK
ncbi:membrane protein insertase YidC [Mangrovactinospora gilvigrisea]|uniref:Membrane protein insertase YidC n=1 Tax=Mangrovactinospora gilvigrisea TaxID=1428644 RepID=A0A1J7BEY2_9ACTN|nr:membrane protein insertase YidC [Mangrovactinospora gilvigrisea]